MIWANIKGLSIPEGAVKQIADSAGRVLWKNGVNVKALAIGYSGEYTDQLDITMDGKTYRLLTLTSSGTLTIEEDVQADIWLCSGGNGGGNMSGGGGGYFREERGVVIKSAVCTVGAGARGGNSQSNGGTSAFGSYVTRAQTSGYGEDGASGGGGAGYAGFPGGSSTYGEGGGVTTVPFGETTVFDPHCAGGAGGNYYYRSEGKTTSKAIGGAGGSNGSDGYEGARTTEDITTIVTQGGFKGGGVGGTAENTYGQGGAANFYGSGGGGGGQIVDEYDGDEDSNLGGAGYQGVIYVRIPYDQPA